VDTKNDSYIIKQYLRNYDFDLANILYKIYNQNNVLNVAPINQTTIKQDNYCYNIFKYIKGNNVDSIPLSYLKNLICLKKEVPFKYNSCIQKKILKYYEYLSNISSDTLKIKIEEIKPVFDQFNKIRNKDFINNLCIVHGDISKSNIICNKKDLYLIDFDEVSISFELYEFAMIAIKMFYNDNKMNWSKYNKLKSMISKNFKNYTNDDFDNSVKYCLCKILLEKYYLYQIGKIDLFSSKQQTDSYLKYLKLLESME